MTEDSQKLGKFFRVGGTILLLLVLLGGGGYYAYKKMNKKPAENVEIPVPEKEKEVFVNDVIGVQEDKKMFSDYIIHSENYALREITFGGYEVNTSGETKNSPLEISDIKGETVISKDGKSTKFLFSWKTNKMATSNVTYAKNDGPIKNTLTEPGPGFSHAIILNFEPSTRYTYYVEAEDRWGNKASSDKFSAFTSTKSDNIVDLIASQFKQIFSWMKI